MVTLWDDYYWRLLYMVIKSVRETPTRNLHNSHITYCSIAVGRRKYVASRIGFTVGARKESLRSYIGALYVISTRPKTTL